MNTRSKQDFIKAVNSSDPVSGLTHSYYKYPARFSPLFVRESIKLFSRPGDIVLDPFMGGGTTLVEASVLGRKAIGVDINSLAVFIAKAKTSILSRRDIREIKELSRILISSLNLHRHIETDKKWKKLGYLRNLNCRETWPIRKVLQLALFKIAKIKNQRQRLFFRCALLKTAQWALDCKEDIPSAILLRHQLMENLHEMLDNAEQYSAAVIVSSNNNRYKYSRYPVCLRRSAIGIEHLRLFRKNKPKLIITSPPYPGVHVLYHRWQVRGRKETPAPYWIADCYDGSGAAFYTFGDRKQKSLDSYYKEVSSAFCSIARITTKSTIMVQLIAFSEPDWQLPRYLETMKSAGFRETLYPTLANSCDGRLWRDVPNRKWYARHRGDIPPSKEVVLFHKLSR